MVTPNVLATEVIAILGTEPARLPVLQVGRHSSLSNGHDTYIIGGRVDVPTVHTEALAGRSETCTCRCMSAASAGASGDRVLASLYMTPGLLLQVFVVLYVVICVAPLCLVVDTAAYALSRGRATLVVYLTVCLFPLLGLFAVPLANLRAHRRARGADRRSRDEFEVDETTPEGLRSVSVCITELKILSRVNTSN